MVRAKKKLVRRSTKAAAAKIMEYLQTHKCITRGQAARLGISFASAYYILRSMAESGLLVRFNMYRWATGDYAVYCLPDADVRTAVEAALKSAGVIPRFVLNRLREIIAGAKTRVIRIAPASLLGESYKPPAALTAAKEYVKLLLDGSVIGEEEIRRRRTALVIDVAKARQRLGYA
ncbi:hypothetical protein [Pyrobaculum sp.]|uniref:hypothetical protein n=1 Tax=Pyrobaculum sp. TaxID=2004705 RepID=UPI003D0EF5D5